jgi:HlyD family secretion protein
MKKIIIILSAASSLFLYSCSGNNKKSIEASGNIEATNVTLSSKVAGQIQKLYFNEGDKVKAGDTLLTIDHDLLAIQLRQAEASVDGAKSQLLLLKQGSRNEDVIQAEEGFKQAKTNMELAQITKDRNENLYNSKSITKQAWDDISAKYNIANAQYVSAMENMKKIKNLARPEEIKQAEANLNKQIAAADLLKKNIIDSYVTSPLNGFVVKKFAEEGESVAQMSSLLMISDLSYVDLVIYVSETELGKVQLGQEANVTVDTFLDKTFKGKVIYISPNAEFTPKNIQTKDERVKLVFAVKIHIPNPNYELKDGITADAVIALK